MSTTLRHRQQEAVFRALLADVSVSLSEDALWAEIKSGKWDEHPKAGAPQGAPYKPAAAKGKRTSIYPTPPELAVIDAGCVEMDGASRTEWLLRKAGIRLVVE